MRGGWVMCWVDFARSGSVARGGHKQSHNDGLLDCSQKGLRSKGHDKSVELAIGTGERLRLLATSQSWAVKYRAAGRLDRMIFADPVKQEYFHELISSLKHDMGVEGERGRNDLNRSLKPTHSCAHYDGVLPVKTQPHSLSAPL